jgi:hypothetical protein
MKWDLDDLDPELVRGANQALVVFILVVAALMLAGLQMCGVGI